MARTDVGGSAYYHADGNGNITAMINAQRALVAKYLYDPFGNNPINRIDPFDLYEVSVVDCATREGHVARARDAYASDDDVQHGCVCTPATAKALACRFSSSITVAGRLAEPQLRWRTNRAKNLSRDQFADSPEVTYERRLWRRNNPVQREIRA